MNRLLNVVSRLFVFAALLLLAPGGYQSVPAASDGPWQEKVDSWLLEQAPAQQVEFLIVLKEQADLSPTSLLTTREAKGEYVFRTLTQTARRTQAPLLAALTNRGVEHRSYWIANMVWVRGDLSLIQFAAERSDVARIHANPWVKGVENQETPEGVAPADIDGVEWNIYQVGAPLVWEAGFTGQGAVIAGQDTGYEWTHPALKEKYRGWDGVTADHDYNWHDAIHDADPTNRCGSDSSEPCDDYGHGTHTMGTMVGDDSLGNQIGMAPGARWIGCRNMEEGWGTPATYSECFEWFLAPYPVGASSDQGDPDKSPHVINNSWACVEDGCEEDAVLKTVVENTRAAGILVVSSAGNSGPSCSTVNTPTAIYEAAFTVGATDNYDGNIAHFSSRGPVTADDSGRLKPDITAPGAYVRSSILGDGYGWASGTSMAAPHVAGLAGLLISAQPALAGDVDELESLMTRSALPLKATVDCGDLGLDAVPNNTYGWGRISAWDAFQQLHQLAVQLSAPTTVAPGQVFAYTFLLEHHHVNQPAHDVVLENSLPPDLIVISATEPYTLSAGSVRWELPTMAAGETVLLEIHVQASEAVEGTFLTNEDYWAWSAETPVAVGGSPALTFVGYRPDIAIGPDQAFFAIAGSSLTYSHTITNTGNLEGQFLISCSSLRSWELTCPVGITLEPEEARKFAVSLILPPREHSGVIDITIVVAETQGDFPVQGEAVDTTTVAWPYFFPFTPRNAVADELGR
jgi:serine protease AprX